MHQSSVLNFTWSHLYTLDNTENSCNVVCLVLLSRGNAGHACGMYMYILAYLHMYILHTVYVRTCILYMYILAYNVTAKARHAMCGMHYDPNLGPP